MEPKKLHATRLKLAKYRTHVIKKHSKMNGLQQATVLYQNFSVLNYRIDTLKILMCTRNANKTAERRNQIKAKED